MASIISVRNLTFAYMGSERQVLRDVSFDIEEGSVTAFVGQVGAGKSTLFRTLNGLIPSIIEGDLTGEIIVAGQSVKDKDTAQMARYINCVFDDPSQQIVSLTAEEDVAFGPANLNLPREEIWARVREAMERVNLKGFEKRDPRSMSGGEMQLLALAGMLAMRPQVIALDEPVAMLDPIGKASMLQAVRELKNASGTTILISESGTDVEAVCEFADHVVLMHEGQVLAHTTPGELYANRELVERLQLKVPQVARVCHLLDRTMIPGRVPVTLEEGRAFIKDLFQKTGARVTPEQAAQYACDPPEALAPSSQEPAIIIKNVHHVFDTYPPVHALKGINLEIKKGDFVALLGQNGSGKSTLSFHLVGVEKPTNPDATILVNGVDVCKAPQSDVVQQISYLFQNPANQLFCQTFGEEVVFGPQAIGCTLEEAEERGRQALRDVGLEDAWDGYTLSVDRSAESLLAMASVLAMKPSILIADEPTGGLDYRTGSRVMETLRELNRQGHTIIVITHDMDLAVTYAKRIVILRHGEIFMDGTPREIFCQPERLAETRLAPPQVTVLAQSLAELGFPHNVMTVEEFVALVKAATGINGEEK